MANNTIWAHGNAASFQVTSGVTDIQYTGPGLQGTFAISGSAWLHIPLPTPVEFANVQNEVVAVHVLCDFGILDVKSVVIYDGSTPILSTSGQNSVYALPSPKKISHGISISIELTLEHGPDDAHRPPQIFTINGAGLEYTAPVVLTKEGNAPSIPVQANPTGNKK